MTSFLERDLAASKRFKAKLAAGEIATLCHSSHTAPSLVERMAEHGFEAVLIDCEHTSTGRDRVEEMGRAAALAGTASIVRPEGSVPHLVTGYLGCGIDGLMLPLIMGPAHAQEMVDTFRFSAPYDSHERPLILMIERIEAVETLPEIMKLGVVDAYLVAPADLALSMGEYKGLGTWTAKVDETLDRAVKTIVDAGKVAGAKVNFRDAQAWMEKGVRLLYAHTDQMIEAGVKEYRAITGVDPRK